MPPWKSCRLLKARGISSSFVTLHRILTGWSLKCHPWRLSHNWIYLYLIFFPSADASFSLLIKDLSWYGLSSLTELLSALFQSLWSWLNLNTPLKGSKLSVLPRSVHTLFSTPWQLHHHWSSSSTPLISLFIQHSIYLNIQEKIIAE